jgi:hypothetical protein
LAYDIYHIIWYCALLDKGVWNLKIFNNLYQWEEIRPSQLVPSKLTEDTIKQLTTILKQRQKESGRPPLDAVAFKTPLLDKKDMDDEAIATYCRGLSSEVPQFFEIWSDTENTHILAVANKNVLPHFVRLLTSAFKGAKITRDLRGYEQKLDPETEPKSLLPPWLKPGLYFKVLNCRKEQAFSPLSKLETSGADPLATLIASMESFKKLPKPVYIWISIGWQVFNWGPWADDYVRSLSTEEYVRIRGEEVGGTFLPEPSVRPTSGEREEARKVEVRARITRLFACFRIAVFCEDPNILMDVVQVLKGDVTVFKGETDQVVADPAPFEISTSRGRPEEVNDEEALFMMAGRLIGPETEPMHLLDEYMIAVRRGRAKKRFLPYLFIVSPELSLFVHLPAWSRDKNLTSIDWTRTVLSFPTLPLPPPPDVPTIPLGQISIGGDIRGELRLPLDYFFLHGYILGVSGAGKSTLILNTILSFTELMKRGAFNGTIWLIDPHGDLADDLLIRIDDELLPRVYFFNPFKTPWGMNMLALPPYRDERERTLLVSARVETIVKIVRETVRMISGKESWGHRLETIIRQALFELYESQDPENPEKKRDNPTLHQLLELVSTVGNEDLLREKIDEMGLSEDLFMLFRDYPTEAKAAVYNKLLFFTEPFTKDFTCNIENNLDFAELDKPGNIIIFSLKGLEGQDTKKSVLMGNLILNIYMADMFNKGLLPENERWPVLLFIDEFHRAANIATFEDIVAEARKFKLSLFFAHQGTEQIENKSLVRMIFGNARLLILFRVSGEMAQDAKIELDMMFSKEIAPTLQTIPHYRFLVRFAARGDEEQLPPIEVLGYNKPPAKRSLADIEPLIIRSMEKFRPPVMPKRPVYLQPLLKRPCMQYWAEHENKFPRPEVFPVLWALREYFVSHSVGGSAEWPSFEELLDFISDLPWGRKGKYRRREFILDALNELKEGGFIREMSLGASGKRAYILGEGKPKLDLVLLNMPAPGGYKGDMEHIEMIRGFMEDQVREKLYLPKMLEVPDAPDGILVPSRSDDSWDFRSQIAVEVERMVSVASWKTERLTRVIENIRNDFERGFAKVLVVCDARDAERDIMYAIKQTEDLAPKFERSEIEIFLWVTEVKEEKYKGL